MKADNPFEDYLEISLGYHMVCNNECERMVVARNLIKEAEKLGHLEEYIPVEEQVTYKAAEEPISQS